MSTPNPLVPQGTLPDKGKSHVRIAVFTILAIHVVLLGGLLILGCKKTEEPPPSDLSSLTNAFPPLPPPDFPPIEPTNPPVNTGFPPPTYTPPTYTPPTYTPPTFVTPEPPPVLTGPGTEHVVIKNESFSTIAKKYGVSIRAIEEANPGVDSRRLKIGQKLRIPAASAPRATGVANGSLTSEGLKVYTVKSGDNLTKIASAHDVKIKELRAVNGLRTDALKVGQKLKIPSKNPPPAAVAPESVAPPVTPAPVFPTTPPGPGNP